MESGDTAPDAEYAERLAARRDEAERQARLYRSLGHSRGATVMLIVFLIILTEKEVTASPKALILFPAIASVVLIVRWNRAARVHHRAVRAARYYADRIACLEGQWAGRGQPGTRYLRDDHPAALDLDLFGVGSLFELLCTAGTRPGQDTLAAWLSAPVEGEEVRARQTAAAELRPRLDLHEDLIVLGSEVPDDGRLAYLARASPESTVSRSRGARWFAFATPLLFLAALISAAMFSVPAILVLAALVPQAIVALRFRHYANGVLDSALRVRAALGPLATLLARLERERFDSPRLRELGETLHAGRRSASRQLLRLNHLLGLTAPATVLACRPQLALVVESWQKSRGPFAARLLQTLGDVEALFALATRTRENPNDVFPVVVEAGPCFEAEGLGHPFLPKDRCVLNDVSLGKERRLLMVSGSNMSGKSTFLRTVGINAVLALAGAPVRASRLTLSPVVVGATLRVEDSLREGRSRFYAEALRVRQLLDVANGSIPLLFLLDEIFQGTNSRDRRVGAEAVLRRLLDRGAVGLVTTHDLTLTEIVDLLSPCAVNVHFADQFADGALVFEYRLRKGVVPASNALALLRALGIEI